MLTTLQKAVACLATLTALLVFAAPAQAASAYITDPTYDTTSGGTHAQRAAMDLKRVTYWTNDTHFFVRFDVRNLRAVRGKGQYEWSARINWREWTWLTFQTVAGEGTEVSVGNGSRGNGICLNARKGRVVNYDRDFVRISVPRRCLPKGKTLSYPRAHARLYTSSYAVITQDHTRTGRHITPNP